MARLPFTLQSRFGQRVVALFILCALLPILAIAAIGFGQVRRQLLEQADAQLRQAAKSVGMGLFDQLRTARTVLGELAVDAGRGGAMAERSRTMFTTVMRVRGDRREVLVGDSTAIPLDARTRSILDSGAAVLSLTDDTPSQVWMAVPAPGGSAWALVNHGFLFSGARERAAVGASESAICVTEGVHQVDCPAGAADRAGVLSQAWNLFLGYDYDARPWQVRVTEPESAVLAPVLGFRRTFIATIIATIALVIILIMAQVRRGLRPLEALRAGTERIARRDFSAPVVVKSRDEFEELATSFNTMTVELAGQFAANHQLIGRLEELSYGALAALARAVDASSHWTAGHSERVTSLSLRMAEHLGLAGSALEALRRGGLLHDIGKIGISPDILDKPGRLAEDELQRIREHPAMGARILAPLDAFAEAIPVVLHHHERWDGAGYPHGLAGEKIPMLARLLAVADVYDALVSERPYRRPWEIDAALDAIRDSSGRHFDPAMVAVFFKVMDEDGDSARFALRLEAN